LFNEAQEMQLAEIGVQGSAPCHFALGMEVSSARRAVA
jgi:hypothetical protein